MKNIIITLQIFSHVILMNFSCLAMEEVDCEKEAFVTRPLTNPRYNQKETEDPLNDILEDLPMELDPPSPHEVLQQLKQENFLSNEITRIFNNLRVETIFQTTNPLHLNYITQALNESHQVIMESFAVLGNARDLKDTESLPLIAKIKFLFFVELINQHINQPSTPRYPFFQKFPASKGIPLAQTYNRTHFKALNSHNLKDLLHDLKPAVSKACQQILKEINENPLFCRMQTTAGSKNYKSKIQKIKRIMGCYIEKYVSGIKIEPPPERLLPLINLNFNNNLMDWQLPPRAVPALPLHLRPPEQIDKRPPQPEVLAFPKLLPKPGQIKKRVLQNDKEKKKQPPLKKQNTEALNQRVRINLNRNGASFFGTPALALPATVEERNKYTEILRSLKECKKNLHGDNYCIAKSAIKLIAQFHAENTQVCQNMYNQFMAGEPYYLAYQYNPEIILHCEQPDMNIEERAANLYLTLKKSYDLAVQESLLSSFFSHAFISPATGLICLEGAQKKFASWYEDQLILITARNNSLQVQAENHNIYDAIQETVRALEMEIRLPELGFNTLATYKKLLTKLSPPHPLQEAYEEIQEAEGYFEKHVPVGLLTEKVVATLQAKNYIADSDTVTRLIHIIRGNSLDLNDDPYRCT